MYDKSDKTFPVAVDSHVWDIHPRRRKQRESIILAELTRLRAEQMLLTVEALARNHDPDAAYDKIDDWDDIQETIDGLEEMLKEPTHEEMVEYLRGFIAEYPEQVQAEVIGELASRIWPEHFAPIGALRQMETLQTRLTAEEHASLKARAKEKGVDDSTYARTVLTNLGLIEAHGLKPFEGIAVAPAPYKRLGAKRTTVFCVRLKWINAREVRMVAKSYEVSVSDLLRFALTLHVGQ